MSGVPHRIMPLDSIGFSLSLRFFKIFNFLFNRFLTNLTVQPKSQLGMV